MIYKVILPNENYGGEGSIQKAADIINSKEYKRITVFTDKGVVKAGLFDVLKKALDRTSAKISVVDNIAPEPSYVQVQAVIDDVENTDLIVAIGGGSVMDSAKLCSILIGAPYTVKDLLDNPYIAKKMVPSLMIPTTCGTGSEATYNAIVAVPEKEVKVGIVNEEMLPDHVILDPKMIAGLPKNILAATGVDALAHAVECITSNKATPFSDVYAFASAKLILENIRAAYSSANDMTAKNNMMLGAYYGGIAIAASGTTAVHALSYPLGGKFHIPHGVSNAILFAHVMSFNKDACLAELSRLCDAIKPELTNEDTEAKAQYVIDEISDIVKYTEIPTNLSGFGIQESDLDLLVTAASKVKRLLDNNKKEITLDDIRAIYLKVM